MPARLTPEALQHLAALASLELDPHEEDDFARQLGDILGYVDALRLVDATGVAPMSHAGLGAGRERDDTVQPSLPRDPIVAAAPDGDEATGLLRVPRVIG
ncbi:MAG TPA: Asp-tRNA(Asn)/Glu-tRNA(Gln) amidotransferase subunit GatC [Vicinamibacterales bacterium]|jgi:aspartyl-tRNA(Asn)/glutamyl-tRNA(Gln) amidotransferase subunit C